MLWVALVLFYGVAKGIRDACKKEALKKNSLPEVLLLYTAVSFLMVIPFAGNVFSMPAEYYLWIFLKSSVIFCAWLCGFYSISKMPISMYGVMDMTGVLFSVMFGCLWLKETLSLWQIVGLTLVLAGLFWVGMTRGKGDGSAVKLTVILSMLAFCLLNSLSGTMDKLLMRTGDITSGQLQFWYMFFLTLMYLAFVLISRTPVKLSTFKTNPWILIMAVLFVLSDRALFVANGDSNSRVTVMTVLKQISGVVTILIGRFFYKEEKILQRALCAGLILTGIVISLL